MKYRLILIGLLVLIFIAGCSGTNPQIESTSHQVPSTSLPLPGEQTFQAPDVEITTREFLDSWKAEDYAAMYALLTELSKAAISEEDFTARYLEVAVEAALSGIDAHILSSLTGTSTAQVSYRVILHSVLIGDIQRDTVMNLSLENGEWRISWEDAMILPELAGGNHFQMEYSVPSRANIYDQEGRALVAQADAVAIGLRADMDALPIQEANTMRKTYSRNCGGLPACALRTWSPNSRNTVRTSGIWLLGTSPPMSLRHV